MIVSVLLLLAFVQPAPSTYTVLMVVPLAYELADGSVVELDDEAEARALAAAEDIEFSIYDYSEGMGDVDVTVQRADIVLPFDTQHEFSDGNGTYVDGTSVRVLFDTSAYDAFVVMTDPDATTSTYFGATSFPDGDMWVRADEHASRTLVHEFSHYLELRLSDVGYTNFPICDDAIPATIHCATTYGYAYNSTEWFDDYYSGDVWGMGMGAEAWNT